MAWLDNPPSTSGGSKQPEPLLTQNSELKINIPPELKLKPLSEHLKYEFLTQPNALHVIIYTSLYHMLSIGWTIANIRGISPNVNMHKILLEEEYKPILKQ